MFRSLSSTNSPALQRVLLVALAVVASTQFALFHALYHKNVDFSVRQLVTLPGKDDFVHNLVKTLPPPPRMTTGVLSNKSQLFHQPIAVENSPNRTGYARAFEPWPSNLPVPCFPPKDKKNYHQATSPPNTTNGFIFMKLMKTGGSTAAGINLRIMRQIAKDRNEGFDFCRGRFDHAWGHEVMAAKRFNPSKSFAWTIVREPTKRAVSQFFHFQVSRENIEPTDFHFQRYLNSEKRIIRHHYLQVLNSEKIYPSSKITNEMAPDIIKKIFEEYNFIGVTERMEETAVCLMMLLNLKMGSILYLNAKKNGAYDDGGHKACTWIKPSQVSRGMERYFKTSHWVELVAWDEVFYRAAHESLDMTIESLGRKAFESQLEKFRKAQKVATDRCMGNEVFPCTSEGKRNRHSDCLWKDSGCGVSCLDKVATDLGLW